MPFGFIDSELLAEFNSGTTDYAHSVAMTSDIANLNGLLFCVGYEDDDRVRVWGNPADLITLDEGGIEQTAALQTIAGPSTGERFGGAVALSGDYRNAVLAVGAVAADSNDGRVYVYRRTNAADFALEATITALVGVTGFGNCVDIYDDSVLVGMNQPRGDPTPRRSLWRNLGWGVRLHVQ